MKSLLSKYDEFAGINPKVNPKAMVEVSFDFYDADGHLLHHEEQDDYDVELEAFPDINSLGDKAVDILTHDFSDEMLQDLIRKAEQTVQCDIDLMRIELAVTAQVRPDSSLAFRDVEYAEYDKSGILGVLDASNWSILSSYHNNSLKMVS